MNCGLEDSFQTALDYEAEVAYISMTSPLSLRSEDSLSPAESEDEFDFSEPAASTVSGAVSGAQVGEIPTLAVTGDEATAVDSPTTQLNHEHEKAKPPQLSKLKSPRPPALIRTGDGDTSSEGSLQSTPSTPISPSSSLSSPVSLLSPVSALSSPLSPLNLDLQDGPPSTPRSQLRRIKQAQAPPSPKPRPKLEQADHLYCTLVVYGSSGCGRTHLVEKLSLANPSLFAKVVTTTTRRKRAHEAAGVDFHFVSHQEMSVQIARGEFIEHVKVHRRGGGTKKESKLLRRAVIQQASLNMSPASLRHQASSTPPPEKISNGEGEGEKKFGSLFDLTEEDSPKLGGEIFGTSHQSLDEAIQQGKPCILINVNVRGAQQLKKAGLKASYVLIQNHSTEFSPPSTKTDSQRPQLADSTNLEPDHVISSASLDVAYSNLHQFAEELVSELKQANTSSYSEAKYQWEALPTVQFEQTQSNPSQKLAEVSFSEILAHFQTTNLKKQMERVKAEQTRPPLFSPSRLSKRLQGEKLLLQAALYYQLNEKEKLHLRILQTLYSKLTGNTFTCRRFGSHWQEIGFSGVDPVDDMQEVGLLGPAQLLYFLENPRTGKFCKEIFQYCHRSTHVIPFVVMAFEFSQLSLQALESGVLNKICNKRDQVFVVVNEFYMAAFHHYYLTWKSSQKSILQLGLLMQQCGDYCKSHPRQVMQAFDENLSIHQPQNQLLPALLPKIENGFTPFDEITTSVEQKR